MNFIYTYKQMQLVNTAHIIRMGIDPPSLEQTKFRVVAYLTQGTAILEEGTEEDCVRYMARFA